MNNKREILTTLRDEFNRWEHLLAGLSEAQITTPRTPSGLSIKDEVAHLRAWQQRSIAHLEAALHNREPEMPPWPTLPDPEAEAVLDLTNAWIYETHRDQPWSSVYREWRDGFLRFLELGEAIPESDLLAAGRYPWLEGHPLTIVFQGSYEHHHDEHYGPLVVRLRAQGVLKDAA